MRFVASPLMIKRRIAGADLTSFMPGVKPEEVVYP
jgi:hypothetical protein